MDVNKEAYNKSKFTHKCNRKAYFYKEEEGSIKKYCNICKPKGAIFDKELIFGDVTKSIFNVSACGEPELDFLKRMDEGAAESNELNLKEDVFIKKYYDDNVLFT